MSLRSLHGNLMNSQQGHFEQSEPLTKNNWQDAVQAIQALITRSKKQRKGKMQSTGKLSLSLKDFIYMYLDYSFLIFLNPLNVITIVTFATGSHLGFLDKTASSSA